MFEIWQEIYSAIKKNKLRSFLIGFAVAWGVFMLMVLLGAGNGLANGVRSNFNHRAKNVIFIWNAQTNIAYAGFKPGRRFEYFTSDYEEMKALPGVNLISGRFWMPGQTYSYGKEYADYSLHACYPDYAIIENYTMLKGRFLNDIDIQQKRKNIVIGADMEKALFGSENPIGKVLRVGSIPYTVVGVYYAEGGRHRGTREGLIPLTTAQVLFNSPNRIHGFTLTTHDMSKAKNMALEQHIRRTLAKKHHIHPDDKRAVGVYNTLNDYAQTMAIFSAINIFIWIIGIGTLIAGVVGVSNIMLISVKERTKEFGIRKALGASPNSIIGLVLLESIFITSLAGYIGLFFGVSVMELVNHLMEKMMSGGASDMTVFLNPTVDLGVAISAMLLLVLAGTFAGYIPARQAALVKPIEALHDE